MGRPVAVHSIYDDQTTIKLDKALDGRLTLSGDDSQNDDVDISLENSMIRESKAIDGRIEDDEDNRTLSLHRKRLVDGTRSPRTSGSTAPWMAASLRIVFAVISVALIF